MMQNIDPKYQQKAEARAAAVTHTAHRNRIPSLLVCGAAACCAAFAAAIIVPKLKAQQIETAMSETQDDPAEQSEYELVSKAEVQVDPLLQKGISDQTVRVMAPAYAPYMLELSGEQLSELDMEITAAVIVKQIEAAATGEGWKPCDTDLPVPDGEAYSIFVYNSGTPYRLTAYSDNTIVVEAVDRDSDGTRWQLPDGIYSNLAEIINSEAEHPQAGRLTWVDPDTVNASDIWKNTNVAAKECDMTTKDGVFYKVRNTMDYYNRASGMIISGTTMGDGRYQAQRSTFRADLNAAQASECLDYFYSPDAEKLMNGCEGCEPDNSGSFIYAKYGERFYDAQESSHTGYSRPGVVHRIDCPPVENDDCKPEQMDFDDFDFYNSRRQILEGMALDSFEFSKLILGYLYEFDKWDIVGNEEVNGRSCVHIKGKLSTKAIFYELAKDYDMYVDEATGAIVKLLSYDENGNLTHFVATKDLAFEDDAEPVELPDFSGYDIHEMTEPAFFANPVGESGATGEPVTDAAEQ